MDQVKIGKFEHKKDAINYLINETGLPKEECSEAYDFVMKTNFDKINKG